VLIHVAWHRLTTGVTKHHTGHKHRSLRDLFMQISNIPQQPADIAML